MLSGAAEELLRRDAPTIIFELCPYALEEQGDSADALLGFLAARGYKIFDQAGSHRFADNASILRIVPRDSSVNLLAVARRADVPG